MSFMTIHVDVSCTQLSTCSPAVDSGPPTLWSQTSHPWHPWQNYISQWSWICHAHALQRQL